MTNLKINDRKKTIEMTKAFAKKASYYGTEEYIALKNAKADNPTYRPITVSTKRTKPTFKGLTFDYMEHYIKVHDDKEKSIMAEYNRFRGKSNESKEMLADTMSYGAIKKWFLAKFPEFEQFHDNRSKNYENVISKKSSPEISIFDKANAEKKTA